MKSEEITCRDEQGTYVKLVPTSKTIHRIHSVASKINIENLVSSHSMHTTVIYSKVQCHPAIHSDIVELPITANGSHFDVFENADGTKSLVLVLDSEEIHALHTTIMTEHNATHDFPSFIPHITLSYDYSCKVPSNAVIEYFQDLTFGKFVVEPLLSAREAYNE